MRGPASGRAQEGRRAPNEVNEANGTPELETASYGYFLWGALVRRRSQKIKALTTKKSIV
jgi:hypothetical protein